jgi:MFS superfamily sulfate permease-like transporter
VHVQGVIIFIEQLIPMLGLSHLISPNISWTPLNKFIFLCQHISQVNIYTAIMSSVSLALLIGTKLTKQRAKGRIGRVLRFLPEIFIVVLVSTSEWRCGGRFVMLGGLCLNIFLSCAVVTGTCRLDKLGIDVLGKIQTGAGSPFGLPFTTKYLKYFKETVSRSLPASIAQPSNQNSAFSSLQPQ